MAQDVESWKKLVEKGLKGAPFDKLVHRTPEGIELAPLYNERPEDPPPPGAAPFVRGAALEPFKVCVRVEPGDDVAGELDGGAEAVWCGADDGAALELALERGALAVRDTQLEPAGAKAAGGGSVWSSCDWIGEMVRGALPGSGDGALDAWPLASVVEQAGAGERCIRIGGLAFHDAGADPADELAFVLSSLVATLRHLDDAGIDLAAAERMLWAQVAVGRDTFGEVCKLRALRVLWHKVLAAAGVAGARLDAIHAVCSSRTLSRRDPWVNMLRATTQVFAAVLGGAQLVTPLPYDAALASRSPLGQRVARNTALVLREESQLGRVIDPAGGSFYIETRTDALARAAWERFTAIERDGGVVAMLRSGALRDRLEATWTAREAALARRKQPVLGVSEFANLSEAAPGDPAPLPGVRRDAEAFETLRARVEASPRDVSLILLGAPAEHRARAGYAKNLFGVAGLASEACDIGPGIDVACLCGSDERYASDAADAARSLKAAGARRVVLAGRPGQREAELRDAGVDAFVFVGCDVLATLEEVLL